MDKSGFIAAYGQLAQDIAERTGLDPALVLGQAGHETGWGQHISGNNIFGISPGGKVAAYPSVPEAAQAYVDLINNRYQKATQKTGIESQAQGLSAGGYGPNGGYGRLIANAAQAVQQAGYKPVSPEDADVQNGIAAFERITGMKPPPMPSEPAQQTSIDVSSDPEVDRGEEIFKQVTGIDPNAPQASAQTAGGGEATPGLEPAPGKLESFGAGVARGAEDVGDVASQGINALSKFGPIAAIDKALPFLGQLDQKYGDTSNQAAAQQAYTDKYGDSIPAMLGRVTGNTVTTLPLTMGIGAAGGAVGSAVTNPLLRLGVGVGTGALQGAGTAGLTGNNMIGGAIGGGAVGALAPLAGGLANSLQPGGALAGPVARKIADSLVALALKGGGAFSHGLPGYLVGEAATPIIQDIVARYGPGVAQMVATSLRTSANTGLSTGVGGLIGAAGINKLQPIP